MRKPDYPIAVKLRKLPPDPSKDEMFIRVSGDLARKVCSLQTDRADCPWMFKAKQLLKSVEFLNP